MVIGSVVGPSDNETVGRKDGIPLILPDGFKDGLYEVSSVLYGVGNKVSAINGVFDTVEETLGGDVAFVGDGIFVGIGDVILIGI